MATEHETRGPRDAPDPAPGPGPDAPALPAPPADATAPGPLGALALVAVGLLAFLAVARLQRAVLPYPEGSPLGPKLEHLAADPDAYDLVYLGSSTVYRHFVPAVFDARMAELGYPLRSLNLGAPGLGGFEADAALRELAAVEGLETAFVLLEPSGPTLELPGFRAPTARQVHAHDPVTVLRVLLEARAQTARPRGERLEAVLRRLRCAAWRLANYGQGPRLVDGLRGRAPHDADRDRIAADAGYLALEDDPDPTVARRRAGFLADPSDLAEAVARLDRRRARPGTWATPAGAWHGRQADAVRALGATPVHVLSATTMANTALWALADAPGAPPLLAYNLPATFPRLYRAEGRFDKNHLARDEAAWLSRRLAEDLVARLGPELDAWRAARGGD